MESSLLLFKPKTMIEYTLPRIHRGMALADLKEEAIVRGLDVKSLSKKKGDLLDHLVEGSIHLKEAFDVLKKTLESELPGLRAENKRRNDEKVAQLVAKVAAAKQIEENAKVTLHQHSFPSLHPCKLAFTEQLMKNGKPRVTSVSCDRCKRWGVACKYTCEACSFDICALCSRTATTISKKRKADPIVENIQPSYQILQLKEAPKSRAKPFVEQTQPKQQILQLKEAPKPKANPVVEKTQPKQQILQLKEAPKSSPLDKLDIDDDEGSSSEFAYILPSRFIDDDDVSDFTRESSVPDLSVDDMVDYDSSSQKRTRQRCTQQLQTKRQDLLEWKRYEDEELSETELCPPSYEMKQFTNIARNPPPKSKVFQSKLGYTVWCSSGYPPDRWYSYAGPPTKEFDSTWKTKDEANLRAKYLFYWKNCYGLHPNELFDYAVDAEADQNMTKQGLLTLWIHPDDSEEWTVGVVSDVAFEHLDNATSRRHCYDKEHSTKRIECFI